MRRFFPKKVGRPLVAATFLTLSLGFFVPTVEAADPVPKLQFRQQFEEGLIKGFCAESKFASECYDMDVGKCKANVKTSLTKCHNENPSPAEISHDKLASYGKKLGRCVGLDFESRNKSKLRSVSECKNPVDWLGK